ncbi:phosphotransferase [Legionella pneumophila subsp. fraseri]|nr:phosphotransferase [Legionella pneumophila subsp. fraseri]HAT1797993.1 phosphotransferase [Legionella pneumophila]MDW8961572.1 phosphotransferase [Legionella pneumophila subsp. fraseri]HAT1846188.1 phosphotransferase [Legionella pneumophila]HAT1862712.1 phosphotransferase [Legionella pneumophila]
MILKNPTWQTLIPGLPDYVPLDSNQAESLLGKVQLNGVVYQVCFEDQLSNFYLIKEWQSGKKYFVKCFQEEHFEHYQQAEHLARWLQIQGVNTNSALSSDLKSYYLYPFLDGDRLNSSIVALKKLGGSLAKMHMALRNYPLQESIIAKTDNRIWKLNEIREQIAKGAIKIGPFPDYVRNLALNSELNFTQGADFQAIHGDLHPGNMLMVDGDVYFFDFEDALHSYLPLIYELALILERMVFIRYESIDYILELGKHFMVAYLENGGAYSYQETDRFALSTIALRSLCVLTLCEMEGNIIYEQEWRKFYTLSELAKKLQTTFNKILQV